MLRRTNPELDSTDSESLNAGVLDPREKEQNRKERIMKRFVSHDGTQEPGDSLGRARRHAARAGPTRMETR